MGNSIKVSVRWMVPSWGLRDVIDSGGWTYVYSKEKLNMSVELFANWTPPSAG